MNDLYPWQADVFADLQQRRVQGRLPHALLISGPVGIGKQQLANVFSQSLLCAEPQADDLACGQCHACSLYAAGTHPDLFRLSPEEDSKVIKIDQIRTLIEKISLSSHYGRYRMVILNPADAMNIAAANALLKTLEEPLLTPCCCSSPIGHPSCPPRYVAGVSLCDWHFPRWKWRKPGWRNSWIIPGMRQC